MHVAAAEGHEEVCRLIIDHTNDKSPKNALGLTPLDYAVQNGRPSVAKLLSRHSFDFKLTLLMYLIISILEMNQVWPRTQFFLVSFL